MTVRSPEVVHLAHAVIMPGFAGRRVPGWLGGAIDHGTTSVCYFGHNLGSVEETATLSGQLHDHGLGLIATDEEGGIVSRLGAQSGSRHVGAAVLGRADDVAGTREVAACIADDLRAAGIDVNLAPVVDVGSNPDNPVIGVRSFGADPRLVARHAIAYVEGLQGRGVAGCAKHFPGHGDTRVDSHVGLPRLDVSMEVLRERDLMPFRAVARAGVQLMMTAHIVVPQLDPDRPATLSPNAIRLLREHIGFAGPVITDALDMGAIRDTVGTQRGCVDALLAGADVLALGNPVLNRPGESDQEIFEGAVSAVVAAVEDGIVPVERLAEARERIEHVVDWLHRPGEPAGSPDRSADDRAAGAALRTMGRPGARLEEFLARDTLRILDVRHHRNVAGGLGRALIADELVRRVPGSRVTTASGAGPAVEGHAPDVEVAAGVVRGTPHVVIVGMPWADSREMEQLQAALARNPDAVVICLGYQPGSLSIPGVRHLVSTMGDSLPTARALADLLLGPAIAATQIG